MKKPIAMITGASSGIGEVFAKIMAEKGYDLLLSNRNTSKLEELKLQLAGQAEVTIIAADLSVQGAAEKLYKEVHSKGIVPNVLINNAGFGLFNENVKLETDQIEQMLLLNVSSLTILSRLFSEQMIEQGKGRILNIASIAGMAPFPYFAAYSASKSYVINFSRAIRRELKKYNVSVTVLCPGPTSTNFFNVAGAKTDSVVMNEKSFMTAEEVATIGINAMFANKDIVVAGTKNALLANLMKFVPVSVMAKIIEKFAL